MSKKNPTRKSRATLYDLFHKDPFAGKGIAKGEEIPLNFANFFKLSWRNISRIVSVNFCFLIANFPLIFLMLAFSGIFNDTVSSPASSLYSLLLGQIEYSVDPVSAALFGIHGIQGTLNVATTATNVLFFLGALLLFTFGFANVGTSYIIRNIVKGEPIFFIHDFFYAIKRNLKQGFILGALDLLFLSVLAYDTMFFYSNTSQFGTFIFYASLILMFVYLIMRFYMYIVLVTFDLSIFKIIKNAFIFVSLGLKRNLLALLGIVLLAVIDYFFACTILPLGLLLPFIILYGYGAYMGAYAAWPTIKKYMIDPYPDDTPKSTEEPIFTDDVTKS